MDQITDFEDTIEPLGVATGAFLVLVGLGTVAGAPWTTAASGAVAVLKVLGALLTVALGAGLAHLSWTGRE